MLPGTLASDLVHITTHFSLYRRSKRGKNAVVRSIKEGFGREVKPKLDFKVWQDLDEQKCRADLLIWHTNIFCLYYNALPHL